MKVLFINDFKGVDYLNDCVFHGGRSVLGADLVDSTRAWYMYDDVGENRKELYGLGFTITGNIPDNLPVDRSDIEEKIKDKFYDLIIYGSVHRNLDYLDLVRKVYSKNEIAFIDGEDQEDIFPTLPVIGRYFKREIYRPYSDILPIGFAIPKSKIIKPDAKVEKTKMVAMMSQYTTGYTFSYDQEHLYYEEYQSAYYGLTQKKAGWDCMRHYEIVANGALPVFKDLSNLPPKVMTMWDKELLKESNELFWNFRPGTRGNLDRYLELRDKSLEHVRNNLTTEALFHHVLNNMW